MTPEERKLTVKELVELQLRKRGEAMEQEGEERNKRWKEEAMVVRGQIKAALCP